MARFQSLCIIVSAPRTPAGKGESPLPFPAGGIFSGHLMLYFPFYRVQKCGHQVYLRGPLCTPLAEMTPFLLPPAPRKPWSLIMDTISCQQRTRLEFFTCSVSSVKATNPRTPLGKQLPHTPFRGPFSRAQTRRGCNFLMEVPQAWTCTGLFIPDQRRK